MKRILCKQKSLNRLNFVCPRFRCKTKFGDSWKNPCIFHKQTKPLTLQLLFVTSWASQCRDGLEFIPTVFARFETATKTKAGRPVKLKSTLTLGLTIVKTILGLPSAKIAYVLWKCLSCLRGSHVRLIAKWWVTTAPCQASQKQITPFSYVRLFGTSPKDLLRRPNDTRLLWQTN